MSRRTILALLLAVALSIGTRAWTMRRADNCDAYRAGEPNAPATQVVPAGTRSIEVPCTDWIHRQTMFVQAWCMLDVVVFFVFGIYAWRDLKNRRGAGTV